ncbi:MAG: hypothetical protein KME59_13515 [Trichormus sp. ATA11-4-KO1]|jgi:hypothetical protein|nr:hypothetical protein [Trichormus sp. ATA11-4-KO1]
MTPNKFKILDPLATYTFSQYFQLKNPIKEVLAEFDYAYERKILELPRYDKEISYLEFLNNYIRRNIRLINPSVEISIREFLIAPIIVEVCDQTNAELYSEYALDIDNRLKGSLDYLLKGKNTILVIEAKQSDIRRGFTQLAVELIALDKSLGNDSNILYGAVTNGDDWKFGTLDREKKLITEDVKLYRVPEELEQLIRVLVGILQ